MAIDSMIEKTWLQFRRSNRDVGDCDAVYQRDIPFLPALGFGRTAENALRSAPTARDEVGGIRK